MCNLYNEKSAHTCIYIYIFIDVLANAGECNESGVTRYAHDNLAIVASYISNETW